MTVVCNKCSQSFDLKENIVAEHNKFESIHHDGNDVHYTNLNDVYMARLYTKREDEICIEGEDLKEVEEVAISYCADHPKTLSP